jgi:DNA-directed RNA polymerase subunit E'/Rpb7
MNNKDIFMTSILSEKIRLAPHQISKNYRDIITEAIKLKTEGVCTKYGYVLPGSVDIFKISPGIMRMVSLNGDVVYNVQFKADVCNPVIGITLKATIINTNNFGILAETSIKVLDDTGKTMNIPVIETVITKQGVGIAGNVDLKALKIGDVINVEVLAKKFELNDKKISVVGKVVDKEKTSASSMLDNDNEELEPDEVVDDDDLDEEDDEEAEAEEDLDDIDDDIPEIEGEDELDGGSKQGEGSLFDIDELYDESDLSVAGGGDDDDADNDYDELSVV